MDWLNDQILAEACCFLALNEASQGLMGGHKINLSLVSSIVITGGASQICCEERLKKIFTAGGAKNAHAILDKEYWVWTEGMRKINLKSNQR